MSKQAYSKSKGRDWENAVVTFLRECGIEAERRRLTGTQDCGDIGGWPGVVVSCKSEKRINLSGYVDELADQCGHAHRRYKNSRTVGVVLVKRRGSKVADAGYAVMQPTIAVMLIRSFLETRVLPSGDGHP